MSPGAYQGDPPTYQPVVTSQLTPEDSKRVADEMIYLMQNAANRFEALCAHIEQTVFAAANEKR